jgi:hypothetical protein
VLRKKETVKVSREGAPEWRVYPVIKERSYELNIVFKGAVSLGVGKVLILV